MLCLWQEICLKSSVHNGIIKSNMKPSVRQLKIGWSPETGLWSQACDKIVKVQTLNWLRWYGEIPTNLNELKQSRKEYREAVKFLHNDMGHLNPTEIMTSGYCS